MELLSGVDFTALALCCRGTWIDPVENRNLAELLHALLRVLTLLISVMISYCITW